MGSSFWRRVPGNWRSVRRIFARRPEDDVDAELRFHFDERIAELTARGTTPEIARVQAREEFGDLDAVRGQLHDIDRRMVQRRLRADWWDSVLQDLRFAFRQLRKSPGFALAAILTIGLGIAVNTAIFSVVNAVILKPLPYPDPDRIVMFSTVSPDGQNVMASPAKFRHWRQQTSVVRDVSAIAGSVMSYTGEGVPEQLTAGRVSADFFRLFGARTAYGRTFTPREDSPGGDHVVVLGNRLWRRRFASDPKIVGRTISLSGSPYVVIGVLREFAMTEFGPSPELFVPFQLDPASADQGDYFEVAGRLKNGVTLAQADAAVRASTTAYRRSLPNALPASSAFGAWRFDDALVGDVRSALFMLAGAVGFVLLIAGSNIASLMLARATVRKREMAVRAALGGSRGRIVRLLLTESVMVSVAGGIVGLVLGIAGIRALLTINDGGLPRIEADGALVALVDWHVLLFTLVVSLGAGIAFGLVPAVSGSHPNLTVALRKGGGHTGSGFRQHKARSVLVVVEMALALVLLVGSGLLIRSVAAVRFVNPGFDSQNVLIATMPLTDPRFRTSAAIAQTVDDAIGRLSALPGVESAGASFGVPLQGGCSFPFTIVGRSVGADPYHGEAGRVDLSPHYFDVFRIPVTRGRSFTDRDDAHAPPVVIINEAMAKKFWPNGDAIGARISIGGGTVKEFEREPPREIVGVVGDTRDDGLDIRPAPRMFVPLAQIPDAFSTLLVDMSQLFWIVRTNAAPSHGLRSAIEDGLRDATGLPIAQTRSMGDVVSTSTSSQQFTMWLMTVFGASALLLAAVGLYGLIAYSVAQRTREIGIRIALGAERAGVVALVMRQGLRLAIIGTAVGFAGALALSRLISSLLFGVTSRDPLVFVSAPFLFAVVALLALWWPARRASRVDPVIALRSE